MLTHSFEDLVQTFRVLLESHLKLHQLITVDRPEAVGTLETAINAILNSFHNVYDLMLQELGAPVDWYATPELCIILAIRNARHHNKADRIRSIYNYHNQTCGSPTDVQKYLYVDFSSPPKEEDGDCFDVELSWGDIDILLNLPRDESRLRNGTKALIREYINADAFEQKAGELGIDKQKIFINFTPLTLNAGIALQPYIKDHVTPGSVESKFFLEHFRTTGAALTRNHEYKVIDFFLPR